VGKVDHVLLVEGADDGAVDHAAEDSGGVLDRLAPAQLEVVRVEKHGASAQFVEANLETDPGPGGGLGEDHGPGFTSERLSGNAARDLALLGLFHEMADFVSGERFDSEEVFHGSAAPRRDLSFKF